MLPKQYLKSRERKNKSNPSSLKTELELLRAILENLEYANALATMHTQYFLLDVDEARPDIRRDRKRQLLRTLKKFVERSTTGDDDYEL